MCLKSNFNKLRSDLPNIIKGCGSISLGIGTLLLGYAAVIKSSEIWEVVSKIDGLEKAIYLMQDSVDKIERQNELSGQRIGRSFSENDDVTKSKLNRILMGLSSGQSGEQQGRMLAIAPSFTEADMSKYISKKKTVNEIIEEWQSIDSPERREQYISEIITKYLNTGKLEGY